VKKKRLHTVCQKRLAQLSLGASYLDTMLTRRCKIGEIGDKEVGHTNNTVLVQMMSISRALA
jgi:hypothetical protein